MIQVEMTAKADLIFELLFPHNSPEVWVLVTKNLEGGHSRHAFPNLEEAFNFIRAKKDKVL